MTDEQVLDLFGTREEYYHEIAKAYFQNPDDPTIWLNKEMLDLSKSWTNKGERNVRKNVWAELKKVFKSISQDPNLTNGAKHKYDSITLGQLCLFMLLIRMRKRMVCPALFYMQQNNT